jgi:hypothetical protein
MQVRRTILFILLIGAVSACNDDADNYDAILPSPEFDIHVYFTLYRGYPYYMAYFKEQRIFDWSVMGFQKHKNVLLDREMKRLKPDEAPMDLERLTEQDEFFSDRPYNSLLVNLQSEKNRDAGYTVEFRAFKNGFAFRYHLFPGMDTESVLSSEATEFALTQRKQFNLSGETDTLNGPLSGAYDIPVYFISSQKELVEISELNRDHPHRMHLVREEKKPNVYRTDVKKSTGFGMDPGENTITPWRIVRIRNSDSTVVFRSEQPARHR